MKFWQRTWLWIVILGSIFHFIRDVLQSLGISTLISTIVVRSDAPHTGIWNPLNTYIIEITLFGLAIFAVKQNRFGRSGYLTIGIVIMTLLFFCIYWFLV